MDVSASAKRKWDDSGGGDGSMCVDYFGNFLLVSCVDLFANALRVWGLGFGVWGLALNVDWVFVSQATPAPSPHPVAAGILALNLLSLPLSPSSAFVLLPRPRPPPRRRLEFEKMLESAQSRILEHMFYSLLVLLFQA